MPSKAAEGRSGLQTSVSPWPPGAYHSDFSVSTRDEEWAAYFNSWSRRATKEHHSGARVRPRFTHQKAAKELHVGDDTLRLSKGLLWTVKTLISCKPTRYFCFVILLERAEYSSDIFQFAEQAGERQGAREARGIEVFQEPDTSKNTTTFEGGSWRSRFFASPKLEMAPHCLRWGLWCHSPAAQLICLSSPSRSLMH